MSGNMSDVIRAFFSTPPKKRGVNWSFSSEFDESHKTREWVLMLNAIYIGGLNLCLLDKITTYY